MARIVIGIGEMAVSNSAEDVLKTFALGSCVALILLDPKTRIVGMAHVALPESRIDEDKAKKLPGYFADTGVENLLMLMKEKGSILHTGYIVKIAGGANVIGSKDHFQIGKRNVTAIKKILWDKNLPIGSEDIGGSNSRTVSIEMKTGQIILTSSDGKEWRL